MPTINDATVVASAYDTSGNGGRKLVRLSNGWLVAGVKNSGVFTYVSKDNGATWSNLHNKGFNPINDLVLVAVGNTVHVLVSFGTTTIYHYKLDVPTISTVSDSVTLNTLVSNETALGNASLAINDTGTELHAVWASKNATYSSSWNIRYAKGTVSAVDGSVAWGAVEQVSNDNTAGIDATNPTIVINSSGTPVILWQLLTDTTYWIYSRRKVGSSWSASTVYSVATYAQSNPSAIFVPQSINGLANGRIKVTWQGLNATNSQYYSLYEAYSDDGGVTWTSALLVQGSSAIISITAPSYTANKSNKSLIVFSYYNNGSRDIAMVTLDGNSGTWSSPIIVKDANIASGMYPSVLVDFTINFSSPLFIYSDGTKVGFYGTWTVTTISVTQGSIGTKSDKSNVLTYTITTDGTMSTITEKVNGVTVGTKTATSGQSLIAGLTQAQWDAIKYGRYKDATGGLNTLTVEMGVEKWTYTFDKRLATTDDITSAIKSVQDSQSTFLPSVKAKLASAVRSKGGTVNDTDSWDTIKTAIDTMPVKKTKGGTFTVSGASIAVTGLGFNPRLLSIKLNTNYYYSGNSDYSPNLYGMKNAAISNVTDLVRNADGFTIPLNATNYPNGTWIYEAEE